MEKLVSGDIVVVPFPFSNLLTAKKRPALVIVNLDSDDLILCQITSQIRVDQYAESINELDLTQGRLEFESFVRCDKLFTLDKSLILYKFGSISSKKLTKVKDKIISIIKESI